MKIVEDKSRIITEQEEWSSKRDHLKEEIKELQMKQM